MTPPADLIVLTGCKDAQFGLHALLTHRYSELGIRRLAFQCVPHPYRDNGVRARADEFLRLYLGKFDHCLAIFDLEGCGAEALHRADVEHELERKLGANGWKERCAAIAIDPELEAWIWDSSLLSSE